MYLLLRYSASVESRGQFTKQGKLPGNERDGWHGTRRECQLGNEGKTRFCTSITCSLCGIIKTSFDLARGFNGTGFGLGWEMYVLVAILLQYVRIMSICIYDLAWGRHCTPLRLHQSQLQQFLSILGPLQKLT